MTKSEFITAAYLAAIPAVTEQIIKANFPKSTNKEMAETIASLATEIAEEGYKDMKGYLESSGTA